MKLGLGTWHLTNKELPRQAFELGINHFDTADIYGNGKSEEILAESLRGIPRFHYELATKAGRNFTGWQKPWYKKHREVFSDWRPEYLKAALQASLLRLQTDYVDIFYLHNPPASQIRKLAPFMSSLRESKQVRKTGVSLAKAEHGFAAIKYGYEVIQVRVNPNEEGPLFELAQTARQFGVRFIIKEPLARGAFQYAAARVYRSYALNPLVDLVLTGTNNSDHLADNVSAVL